MLNIGWNLRIAAVLLVVWSILGMVSSQGKKKVDIAIVLDQFKKQSDSNDCQFATLVVLLAEFKPEKFDFDIHLGVFLLKESSSLTTVEPFGVAFKENVSQIYNALANASSDVRHRSHVNFDGVMRDTKRKIENETTNRDDAMDVIIWYVAVLSPDEVRRNVDDQIKTKYAHVFFETVGHVYPSCNHNAVGKEPPSMNVRRLPINTTYRFVPGIIALVTLQIENEKCYTTEKWSEQCFFDRQHQCQARIRKVHVCAIEETTDSPCTYGVDVCDKMCDSDTQVPVGACQAPCGETGIQHRRSQKAVDGNDPNYADCPTRNDSCFNDCNGGASTSNQPRNTTPRKITATTATTRKPPKKTTSSSKAHDGAGSTAGEPGLQTWHYIVIALGVLAVVAIVAAVVIVLFFMKGKGSDREEKRRIEAGRGGGGGATTNVRSGRFGMTERSSVKPPRSPPRRTRRRPADRRR